MAITKRDVDALEPGSVIWDSGKSAVHGFGVRRRTKGPIFVLRLRHRKRTRWITIGRFGAPWTVEEARSEAVKLLGEMAVDDGPLKRRAEMKRLQNDQSVASICDRYFEAASAGLVLTRFNRSKSPSTLVTDRGRIERHIKPLLGNFDVATLSRIDVSRMIADISAGKTACDEKTVLRGRAIVTGGKATAARVADLLSGIMTWAIQEGLIQYNPVHGVRRHRSEAKDRYLSNQELVKLGRVLCPVFQDSKSSFHPFAVTIILLLALTGCRLNEIAGLRWTEIDEQNSCLRLVSTKTGRSMRAVGVDALTVLRLHQRQGHAEFVFPATSGSGHYRGTSRQIQKIYLSVGINNASSHTLRHTFGSFASQLGYSDSTIAGLLGHSGRGITSRYIHRPDAELVLAANDVSKNIKALLLQGAQL